jgi:glycosyltransferase involved in cell wall biosynthesis
MRPSATHLVVIPSYNTGATLLRETVTAALACWAPVWVVLDGSTDGSAAALDDLAAPGLRVLPLPRNGGKGAAVHFALMHAAIAGFTHALVMDADGQHPADRIPAFMAASQAWPDAMILGLPSFGPDAPALRVKGRRISNWWANLETLWAGIGDSLCGFRVYPVQPLLAAMARSSGMRRFDFDPEAVVRLVWQRVPPVNLSVPVRYIAREHGGVSHFRYGWDNALLTWMHVRLMLGWLPRLPGLALRRAQGWPHNPPALAAPPPATPAP